MMRELLLLFSVIVTPQLLASTHPEVSPGLRTAARPAWAVGTPPLPALPPWACPPQIPSSGIPTEDEGDDGNGDDVPMGDGCDVGVSSSRGGGLRLRAASPVGRVDREEEEEEEVEGDSEDSSEDHATGAETESVRGASKGADERNDVADVPYEWGDDEHLAMWRDLLKEAEQRKQVISCALCPGNQVVPACPTNMVGMIINALAEHLRRRIRRPRSTSGARRCGNSPTSTTCRVWRTLCGRGGRTKPSTRESLCGSSSPQ